MEPFNARRFDLRTRPTHLVSKRVPGTRRYPLILERLEERLTPAVTAVPLAGWNALGEHPDESGRREVVVLDSRVPDASALVTDLEPGTQVVLLSPARDGLTQIADALAGPAQMTDVHIVGHGVAGAMQLGSDLLSAATLEGDTVALSRLAAELGPDSDLLLYGCQTGAGATGSILVQSLARETGAAVAGSSTAVGAAALGGGWNLDVASGRIDAASPWSAASLSAYPDRLGLTITTTAFPGGDVGQPYSQTIGVSGGTAPVTFAVTGGSLPAGLTLNPTTGVITGIPTTASSAPTFTVLASFTGGGGGAAPKGGLLEDSSGNFFGTTSSAGTNFDGSVFEIPAGTTTPTVLASFNYTDGQYPSGSLVEDSHGNLFGETSEGGANNNGTVFEVAAGSHTLTALLSFAYDVPGGSLTIDQAGNLFGTTDTGGTSNDGTVFEIAAGSDTLTVLASFTSYSNPNGGLLEDSHGDLFGTTYGGGTSNQSLGSVFELAAGSSTITTLATFSNTTGDHPETGVVEDANGDLYGITASGGSENFGTVYEVATGSSTITTLGTFTSSGGWAPDGGLLLDNSGRLFGTDGQGGVNGDGAVFQVVPGSGLVTLASFSSTTGGPPNGSLVEDASGDLFGTTQGGGQYQDGTVYEVSTHAFTITATDATGASASRIYTIAIAGPLGITTTTLPNWTVGQAYAQTITVSGGTGSDTFAVASGSLPTGLTLNTSTGAITGTPTTTTGSPFSFTIKATDAIGAVVTRSYSVTINAAPVIPSTLPNWTVNQSYAQTITVSGGTSPDTFVVSSGNLPTGLTLNTSTGAITGTPTTTAGSPFSFTIKATDAAGATASKVYLVSIQSPLSISPTTLPTASAVTAYNQTIDILGGTTPFTTFAVTAFNGGTTGLISAAITANASAGTFSVRGTPSAGGTATFTVNVVDSAGATLTQQYTLTVDQAPVITSAAATTFPIGAADTFQVTTAAGAYPTNVTFHETGALPAGVTFSSAGLLSGTPAVGSANTWNLFLDASNGISPDGTQAFTLTVNQTTTTTVTATPAGPVNQGTPVTFTATITGDPGVGTVTFYAGPGLTNPIGAPVSVVNGSATSASTTNLAFGSDTITAVYSGGPGYGASQGSDTLVVDATTMTTLVSGPDPSLSGVAVGFTITVTPSGGPALSGETVSLEDADNGDTVLGSAPLSNGVALVTLATLPLGSHNLVAVYGGDTSHVGSQSGTWSQTVQSTFQVDRAVATPNGVELTFDAPVNEASLQLYTSPSTTATIPADVTVVGASTGAVKGSLVLDPTDPYLATFVKTIGLLASDTYTVTVTSAVQDMRNVALAGTFSTSLRVTAVTGPVVAVPSFARGAGQPVNLPANVTTAGIPITLSGLSGALTSASFTLTYDPTLLNITAETLSTTATSAGLALTVTTTTLDAHHEQRAFHLSGGSWTAGASATLVSLTGTVPTTAPYLDKALLNLTGVTVNGSPASGEAAVDEAAYLGDVVGTKVLNGADATYINLVLASGAGNAGFSAYKDLDPVIIGGIASGEASVSSTDALRIEQKLVGTSVPTIPVIPANVTGATTGADPHLFLGAATFNPGQVVTVPEELVDTADMAEPIFALDSVLFFDPSKFTVVGVTDGALLAGYGLMVNVDDVLGTIRVTQSSASPLTLAPGQGGMALALELLANPGDTPGSAVLKLASSTTNRDGTEATAVFGADGAYTLTPTPQGSDPRQSQEASALVAGVDALLQISASAVGHGTVALPTPGQTATANPDVLLAGPLVRSLPGASVPIAHDPHRPTVPAAGAFLTPWPANGTPSVSLSGSADGVPAPASPLDTVWDLELVQDLAHVIPGALLDHLSRCAAR